MTRRACAEEYSSGSWRPGDTVRFTAVGELAAPAFTLHEIVIDEDGATMTEILPEVPAEETRGGAHPDWDRARPGQELPDAADEHYDPDGPDPRF